MRASRSSCATAPTIPSARRGTSNSLLGKRVDGIVVTGRRADPRRRLEVHGSGVPVLYVYSQSDEPGAFGLVPDDEGGARLAVEHLVGLGRRRIAHVTGPERFEAVRLRRDGYRKALKRARHRRSGERLHDGSMVGAMGARGRRRGFSRSKRDAPDAVFCGNDQIARGVADRSARAGHRRSGRRLDRRIRQLGDRRRTRRARRSRPST